MTLLSIIKKDLKLVLRDPGELLTLFLMPLAFILPISFAMGGGDGYGIDASNRRQRLPVANLDSGVRATALLNALSDAVTIESSYTLTAAQSLGVGATAECAQAGPACDERMARELVAQSRRAAALIIPAGFTRDVDAGQPVTLTLIYDPAADFAQRKMFEGIVTGVATEMSIQNNVERGFDQLGDMTAIAPADMRARIERQITATSSMSASQAAAISFATVQPAGYTLRQMPNTYQQTVPGYTVMFVFFIVAYLNGTIKDEKRAGTFKRLLSLPVSRATILGGKLGAAMLIGVTQVVVMFSAGALIFGLQLGPDPLALALLTLALVASATAIGLAAATTRIGGIITAPLIVGGLLGGCIFPLDVMPGFLRTVSMALPHSWALAGYQALMVRNQGLPDILPQIGVLFLFAAVFFAIALRRFSIDE